jgi:hypothetical protein
LLKVEKMNKREKRVDREGLEPPSLAMEEEEIIY